MPRLTGLFGATPVHAAALSDKGAAMLLLGPSGAGKSTLAYALNRHAGMDILSDDISILWAKHAPFVAPAARGVGIWPASIHGLGLDRADGEVMAGYGDKHRYVDAAEATTEAAPLRSVVFPFRSADRTEPRIEAMTLAAAMTAAVGQIITLNPHAPFPAERAVALGRLLAAMKVAALWRLDYPADYGALPGVAALLSARLAVDRRLRGPPATPRTAGVS